MVHWELENDVMYYLDSCMTAKIEVELDRMTNLSVHDGTYIDQVKPLEREKNVAKLKSVSGKEESTR